MQAGERKKFAHAFIQTKNAVNNCPMTLKVSAVFISAKVTLWNSRPATLL